ncbi:MAG TPA: hypothetical protein VGN42_18790 [Pirellulales bacterium]|jgi:hypothetical protein|nr:hypothetical protein [Pirellulales bacterium]
MNEVFRPPRKSLYEALACSVLFAGVAASWLAVWLLNDPPQSLPPWVVWFFCAVEVSFLGFFALGLHGVVAYWRQELHVDGAEVRFRGVFRSATLDLSTVTRAEWRRAPGGTLKLRADGQRLTIPLYREARLMEYLHQQIPWPAQVDWPRFHLDFLRPRVVDSDHDRVDRQLADRYLWPSIAICLAVALAYAIFENARRAQQACGFAAILFVIRYAFPKKVHHVTSMRAMLRKQPEFLWFIGWQLLFLIVLIIYAALAGLLHFVVPGWAEETGVAIYVAGFFATVFWFARCEAIRTRKRIAEIEGEWAAEHDPIRK